MAGSGPFAIDLMHGATNRVLFLRYVTDVLLLPALESGDAVVMDDLSAHKVKGVREAIEGAAAHLLHISVYSSDFNPIEQCQCP